MLILRPTKEPLVPTRGPADWQAYLADPEKHWKDGRSAKNDLYVLGRIGFDLAGWGG